jgi:hypothetical protein
MGRHGWKNTTGNFRKLDVRMMQRKGALRPGASSTWYWSRGGEPCGSISTRAEWGSVVLSYSHQRWGETEWTRKEYSVTIEWTRCHFGGERAWFRCPASGCGRRVAVLWGSDVYACRYCHNLAYESQNETVHSRALGKAQDIRRKLGGDPCGDFPPKPKGMHWRTYYRWQRKEQEAEARSWPPLLLRMLRQAAMARV